MTAIAKIDQVEGCSPGEFKCEKEYPHVTLMLGEWKAVKSNDILNALFNPHNGVKSRTTYSEIMSDNSYPKGHAEQLNVSMASNEEVDCYLVTFDGGPVYVEGVMKEFDF